MRPDEPEQVVQFAPKEKSPRNDADVPELGQAVLALLQKAANSSNDQCERAMSLARKLSMQLRAAEDRIKDLQAERDAVEDRIKHLQSERDQLQDRADRAEAWLRRVHEEVQEMFASLRSGSRQTSR